MLYKLSYLYPLLSYPFQIHFICPSSHNFFLPSSITLLCIKTVEVNIIQNVLSYASDLYSLYFIIWAKVYVVQMKPVMDEVVSPQALRWDESAGGSPPQRTLWVAAGVPEPLQPWCLCLTNICCALVLSLGGRMCRWVSFEEPSY